MSSQWHTSYKYRWQKATSLEEGTNRNIITVKPVNKVQHWKDGKLVLADRWSLHWLKCRKIVKLAKVQQPLESDGLNLEVVFSTGLAVFKGDNKKGFGIYRSLNKRIHLSPLWQRQMYHPCGHCNTCGSTQGTSQELLIKVLIINLLPLMEVKGPFQSFYKEASGTLKLWQYTIIQNT